jgi:TIR domain
MSDIFVSYASADRDRVAPLVQRLEQLGFSVWWDRDIAAGQNFHRVIEQALDQAKCAIVVWSRNSVNSEWVVNEASSARKRNALVPVLLDAVEPPLEFRHLQTADLRDENQSNENEFEKLKRSVTQIIGGASNAPINVRFQGQSKSFWQTPVGWAVAGGVLLIGVAALLAVLKQIGWIGAPQVVPAKIEHSNDRQSARIEQKSDAIERSSTTENSPKGTTLKTAAIERINLLDPGNGAQIVAATEENWRNILEAKEPKCSIISAKSFVVVNLAYVQTTPIATLAVHVNAGSSYNLKTLAVFTADEERGPFKKIGEFDIPNFKNMRLPYHEYALEPVTTRFLKLQVVNFTTPDIPNGNVCSIQLYGAK